MPREVADWSPNPEQLYTQSELRDILTKTIQGLPSSFRHKCHGSEACIGHRTILVIRVVERKQVEKEKIRLMSSPPRRWRSDRE